MQLSSSSFADGQAIPGEFAFAVPDATSRIKLSANRNPHLRWEGAPAGTRSFALLCCDPDVPSSGDDVNQDGRSVPASLPRVDFYHWVLVDLPVATKEIHAGEYSDAITPRGKPGPAAPHGARQGINDYTGWFAGDQDMGGDYYGYDGPCPPWNDELIHRYVFTVYALDVAQCEVSGRFSGADVLRAIKPHVLAQASLTGIYTLNPRATARRS